ncbi:importin beta [Theileria orientalis strain Shintoku]|uniref:Importin beta n=1 Tax=Theileria orientalis strain Shintoku TaxID=869250 RepID=J7MEX4_THEOR|nr:importin beta [Theileria orientalis strain Shintoku]BAM38794.1 importin beta [Theileria orientalis strain Shintoku]|eukprot:XP_009689095.1 importin beta [Theileria orientalis strain Shintoku]
MSQNINSEVFVSLLEALSSTDSAARSDADAKINTLKKHDLNGILRLTLNVMLTEPNDERRLQSIVLVRILLDLSKSGDTPKKTWNSVTTEVKALLKSSLLKSLESETQKSIRRNVCDTIADLCASSLEYNEWPELLTITIRLVENNNPVYKKSGLKLLGECFNYFVDELANHVDIVAQLIKSSLMNADASVRTEALCSISIAIESDLINLTSKLADTVPLILESLRQLLSSPDPTSRDELERSLAGIIMIVDNNAKILKQHIQLFFARMMELALGEGPAQNLDQELRCMALEALVTLPEKKPKMALSIPNFGIRMVNCLMTCMLDVQDEAYSEWLEKGEEMEDEQRLYDAGEEGLDRLGRALQNLDNCPLMDWVLSTASQYIQTPHWQHKFVGIMAISQTVEFLTDEEVEDRMPSIVKIMLEKLMDPDFRIRFAVCQTIGQIALDHQPYVQLNFYEEVLPSLITAFDDASPRVQSHALSAFVNFAEEVQKEHLLPFADVVVQRILLKINMHTNRQVREQAVTSIAVIAGVLEEHFIKYYNTIIPLMKEIIANCVKPEERTCRGKAIECISIIGMSIGKDVFLNDGIECMNALIQIMDQPTDPDDPVKDYVGEALGRFCTALGVNFVPFLPKIVPTLLRELTNCAKSVNEDEDMTLAMGLEGAGGLKTSMVDDLEMTLNLISNIVEELKDLYEEYIPSTAQAVLPLLTYVLTSDMKQRALSAMANMIEAKKMALDKRGGGREMLLDLVLNTMNTVLTDLEKSRKLDSMGTIPVDILSAEAGGLYKCLDCAGPGILNTNVLTVLSKKLLEIMETSSKIKAVYRKCREDKGLDQDEVLALEEDEEEEQTFRSSLLDLFAVIMKHHPEEFMVSCQGMCLAFATANLEKNVEDDVALALYLCDDMVEYLGQRVVSFWEKFLPHILKHVESRDANLRQSACYGVSQLAKIPEFSYLANEAATKLASAMRMKFPASAKNQQTANDNAVAALGDLIKYQGANLVDASNYLNLWLKSLPLKQDETEGRRVHKELMELVISKNPTILGPDNANLAQLAKIFISIYETDLSSEELNKQIIQLMKHLGQEFLKQLAPSLSKRLQMQLKIIAKLL